MHINSDDIGSSLREILKINLLSKFETGNILFDSVFKMFVIMIISSLSANVFQKIINFRINLYSIDLRNILKKKKSLTIRGSRYVELKYMHSHYDFSQRFKAIINKIIESLKNIKENEHLIKNLDELQVRQTTRFNDQGVNIGLDFEFGFIVNQNRSFKIDSNDDIYCDIVCVRDTYNGDNNKGSITKQEYEITIWSYKLNCKDLHMYIENITDAYEKNKKLDSSKYKYIFKFLITRL